MNAIPQELLEQIVRGNVLLFIGEETARDRDNRVVDELIAAELSARLNLSKTELLSFPEIAQLYEDEQGRHALVQFLLRRYEALGGDEPQELHRLVAGLASWRVLVTTCLDGRLERAFEEAIRPLDVVVGTLDVAFEESERTQLYKLRGSLARPDSLVLTEDDYEVFFENQTTISVVLQAYLARKTILFLGYSLDDTAFRRLYRKVTGPLDSYARRSFLVSETLSPAASRWSKRHGVQVIQTDPVVFLEALTMQAAALHRPSPGRRPTASAMVAPLPQHPYKLLDYYEPQDSDIFYGRLREMHELTSLVLAHRLVLLYGASGVGKTSLCLAGMAPMVEGVDPPYETMYVRTLDDPARIIRRTLQRQLADVSLPETGSLVNFLNAAVQGSGRPLIIIFDQFEEFFVRLHADVRQAFIVELGELIDAHDVAVKIVLSIREDWLASMSEIETRIPTIFSTRMRLLPMTREGARQAITGPVERMGLHYEPGLVERLLDDLAGEDVSVMPPQLQLVCSALYSNLAPGELTITLAAYERMGGARGVLYRYLEEELTRFATDARLLARSILEALVSSQQTKRVATWSELVREMPGTEADLADVLKKLVDARLVRALHSGALDEPAYELAHEYLIEQIVISPETRARKEAEELLRQGIDNWHHFGTLLSEDTLALIDERLPLLAPASSEAMELLTLSRSRHRRRFERVLRGVMGGLLGGILGGALGRLAMQWLVASAQNEGDLLVQITGMGLIAAVVGALFGLGSTLGRVLSRHGAGVIGAILGGGLVGMLLGILIDIVFTAPAPVHPIIQLLSGALYGAGMAASAQFGARVRHPLFRLLIWSLLGALIGCVFSLITGPIRITPLLPAVTAGITTGIGLAWFPPRRKSG